jgi:hypothetical protein
MDPNANLAEQRRIRSRIIAGEELDGDAQRLADLVEALDNWISRGGFLPRDWQQEGNNQ